MAERPRAGDEVLSPADRRTIILAGDGTADPAVPKTHHGPPAVEVSTVRQ